MGGPLRLDSRTLGVAEVILKTDKIVAITEDYAGLGRSGEITLARKNQVGDAIFLTPLRFDSGAPLSRSISKDATHVPMIFALKGVEKVFSDANVIDYRGKPVIAVSRFLPAVDWGLVVKIDREEVLAPISSLRENFLILFFLVFFIVLSGAFILARTLAVPISILARGASKLQGGDFSQRVSIRSKDEIGTLGNAFNVMAEKLQELYRGLEQKIKERNCLWTVLL